MSPENSIEAWYKEIGKDEHEEMVKDMERGMEDIDKRVFNAFREVPRHKYVDPEEQRKAYDPILVLVHDKKEYDRAVKLRQDEWRIGELEETPDKEEMAYIDGYIKQKQMAKTSTASQPSLVATMLDSVLPPDELSQQKAVEIGAGTGYVVALLAKLFSNVVGAEIKPELVKRGNKILKSEGINNAAVKETSGIELLEEIGKVDAILVSCGVREDQVTKGMLPHLTDGGRLVAPVIYGGVIKYERYIEKIGKILKNNVYRMELRRYTRNGDNFKKEVIHYNVNFVPYIEVPK